MFGLRCMATAVFLAVVALSPRVEAQQINIGAKFFTESVILAELAKQMLEANGMEASLSSGHKPKVIREMAEKGEIDLYWEYTGTSYFFLNELTEDLPDYEIYRKVKFLDGLKGLVWLDPAPFNNTYALALNLDFAAENCIHSLSDLARAMREGANFSIATEESCEPTREDCLGGMQRVYDFEFDPEKIDVMKYGETYEAVWNREVEVAVVYRSDGWIAAYDLEVLEDDKDFFKAHLPTPVVRYDVLQRFPDIEPILKPLSAALSLGRMQNLNYQVEVLKRPADQVAKEFLLDFDLLKS